jgi:hypothetical protein
MGKYHELMSMAIDKGAEEEAWAIVDETMMCLEKKHPELYDEIMDKLECLAYRIPAEEATEIVKAMRPRGQNWSLQQVKDFLREKGIDHNIVNWYLVMNMCYNDYYDTAKQFNLQSDEDFYFHLAKDFIEDPDAKPLKVEKYFLD